jgi:hypothetical protein
MRVNGREGKWCGRDLSGSMTSKTEVNGTLLGYNFELQVNEYCHTLFFSLLFPDL